MNKPLPTSVRLLPEVKAALEKGRGGRFAVDLVDDRKGRGQVAQGKGLLEGEGREAMTGGWAYYDVNGNRVPPSSKLAAFKGKEASIDNGVPAPPGHGKLGAVEYRDVHAIDQPNLRKTFSSSSKMKAWFREHAAKRRAQ